MALPFATLAEHWREEAERLRRYGARAQATAVEQCASELEATERQYVFEKLTLEEASGEAGVSYDTMSRKVRSGAIPNAGRKGKPLVRRCDLLPNIATNAPLPVTPTGEPDVAEELLRSFH